MIWLSLRVVTDSTPAKSMMPRSGSPRWPAPMTGSDSVIVTGWLAPIRIRPGLASRWLVIAWESS